MKLYEAMLAVECHALCKYKESLYYAYGLAFIHRLLDKPSITIELHDRRAPSVLSAKPSEVSVVDWRGLTEETVKKKLEIYRKIVQMMEGAENREGKSWNRGISET